MNRNNQNEGMRYPSIDQLIAKSPSKYKLVIAVAERAKEIERKKKTYLEKTQNKKSIGIALEEIYHDKVVIKSRDENEKNH